MTCSGLGLCREAANVAEPLPKKTKSESSGVRARALDDDDMFKAKAPAARFNAGGMPASLKKVRTPMAPRRFERLC